MSKAKNETSGSSEIQGRLWGRKARDWAEIEDEGSRALFEAVLDATKVGKETVYLDVGCGSGLACALAAAGGAKVSGLDATPELVEIAGERVPEPSRLLTMVGGRRSTHWLAEQGRDLK